MTSTRAGRGPVGPETTAEEKPRRQSDGWKKRQRERERREERGERR